MRELGKEEESNKMCEQLLPSLADGSLHPTTCVPLRWLVDAGRAADAVEIGTAMLMRSYDAGGALASVFWQSTAPEQAHPYYWSGLVLTGVDAEIAAR
ncbi:MAG: hypothetical protein GY711_24885 [bacterium]|nr:hypothetical protein [bacterium]